MESFSPKIVMVSTHHAVTNDLEDSPESWLEETGFKASNSTLREIKIFK